MDGKTFYRKQTSKYYASHNYSINEESDEVVNHELRAIILDNRGNLNFLGTPNFYFSKILTYKCLQLIVVQSNLYVLQRNIDTHLQLPIKELEQLI